MKSYDFYFELTSIKYGCQKLLNDIIEYLESADYIEHETEAKIRDLVIALGELEDALEKEER